MSMVPVADIFNHKASIVELQGWQVVEHLEAESEHDDDACCTDCGNNPDHEHGVHCGGGKVVEKSELETCEDEPVAKRSRKESSLSQPPTHPTARPFAEFPDTNTCSEVAICEADIDGKPALQIIAEQACSQQAGSTAQIPSLDHLA